MLMETRYGVTMTEETIDKVIYNEGKEKKQLQEIIEKETKTCFKFRMNSI